MLRSKSRSGSFDFGQKSVLSRTISASKLCRGDALVSQINTDALVSVDRKSHKFVKLSKKQAVGVNTMQKQMGELEEEMKMANEQLETAENERDRALSELRETKQVAHEAKLKLSKSLSPKKAEEILTELEKVKGLLSDSNGELEAKENNIEHLKVELEKAQHFESKVTQREEFIDRLQEELGNAKASENHAMGLLSESQKRIQDLEAEMEKGKQSETKLFDSVVSQTKQFEQTKVELEESKQEIASLREKLQSFSTEASRDLVGGKPTEVTKEASQSLESELQFEKERSKRTEVTKEASQSLESELQSEKERSKNLLGEIGLLKNELKIATDAEENSKKAMDDLALALKEVATEAKLAKEKLISTELELEHVKLEAKQLKTMVRSTEERYQMLLDESKKEMELHRNTADRLRLEAEESLLAWNGKEMGFVSCIKRAEEEKSHALHENTRLTESLKAAEMMTRSSREESYKLRDILKQALNEANVAKEAASIAKHENSQLKDLVTEKDEAQHFLTRENERLRINEAAAHENIKELKRLLSAAASELNKDKKEEHEEDDHSKKAFSFDLNELKFVNEQSDEEEEKVLDEDPEKAEALKGSIFDPTASPRSEPGTPKPTHHHQRSRSSSVFSDIETTNSEDCDHLDGTHFDDADGERVSHRRRKSALLRRFGDLVTMKSFHKKEAATQN